MEIRIPPQIMRYMEIRTHENWDFPQNHKIHGNSQNNHETHGIPKKS